MRLNRTTFTLCASMIAATGCAHGTTSEKTQAHAATGPAILEDQRVAASDPVMEPRNSPAQPNTPGSTQRTTTAQVNPCELAVYFATDSASLDGPSRERLDAVAECMKRREVDHATIVGQTDPSGTAEHNEELGMERAKAVATYLRERGVPNDQIRVQSKGEMASAQPVQLWPLERRAGVTSSDRP